MKNLKIKKASAWNFLPFGPEGIELDFSKYKNIVLIKGQNKDALDDEESKVSSNGTGKSSLQEIIVYGLFGKTVKRPEKLGVNDVVHNKVGKDCKVEILFDDYRLIRTRKENGKDKHSLRLWESKDGVWDKNTEITQGTMAATQKKIEDIIGLSYDSFINMCIFTDDQRSCFLESDTLKKKEIVENLLSLAIYREWFDNAKLLRKEVKQNVDNKTKEYQFLLSNQENAEKRLNLTIQKEIDWKTQKEKECILLESKIKNLRSNLGISNSEALDIYLNAQKQIVDINNKIPILEKEKEDIESKNKMALDKIEKLKDSLNDLNKKFNELNNDLDLNNKIKNNIQLKIKNIKQNVPGTTCEECQSIISQENISLFVSNKDKEVSEVELVIEEIKNKLSDVKNQISESKTKLQKMVDFSKQFESNIQKINLNLNSIRNDLVNFSKVKEPKLASNDEIILNQVENLTVELNSKKQEMNGNSPFKEILENDRLELNKLIESVTIKKSEVKELEAELPYYDYWVNGFGDNGIRKWVVDGIIPELNNRINYWLQFLIDNKISLSFDNELNEKIERNPVDGDPYVYHAMSTGQRRRLNLAVSQSFAHIMTLSSGSVPSLIFLDEVSTNVDPLGVQGIYNMILELSEDKQVFVTTHDLELMKMLQNSDVINLCHERGYTKLVN